MSETTIRVLVADDHAVVREGIRHVLDGAAGFAVVAEAASGPEALRQVIAEHPDVVVLDVSMPGESGLRVAAEIRRQVPEARVLILSMHDNTEYVLEAVRAGAHGYILKDTAATDLRKAIQAVHAGESFFSPSIARRLSASARGEIDRESRSGALARLTGRERDVLVGIAKGQTNKEIAGEFGISHRTVETHRESLMRKLRIHTVAGLTKFALETGLVTS